MVSVDNKCSSYPPSNKLSCKKKKEKKIYTHRETHTDTHTHVMLHRDQKWVSDLLKVEFQVIVND